MSLRLSCPHRQPPETMQVTLASDPTADAKAAIYAASDGDQIELLISIAG